MEIQKMVKDAELNSESDKKIRELAESRNQADALVHSTRKALTEFGDKLDTHQKNEIEQAISKLEEVMKHDVKSDIDARLKTLTDVVQKLDAAMHATNHRQHTGAGGTNANEQTGDTHSSAAPDDVVDADFEEVKEPK
jgi:molecular chaperone DnaK